MQAQASRPVNALIAIGLALLPFPALKLLDHLNRDCGDGLCGFFPGLLLLGVLAGVTIVFLVRSTRREETPSALRLVPVGLWLAAFVPLFL